MDGYWQTVRCRRGVNNKCTIPQYLSFQCSGNHNALFTDDFSGPGIVIGPVCVCVCVSASRQ